MKSTMNSFFPPKLIKSYLLYLGSRTDQKRDMMKVYQSTSKGWVDGRAYNWDVEYKKAKLLFYL
jgi:hypothetical protein